MQAIWLSGQKLIRTKEKFHPPAGGQVSNFNWQLVAFFLNTATDN
jgi:hypothetical protein